MDPKTLNLLVHDREAAFYDDRFLITYGPEVGREVRGEVTRLLGPHAHAPRALDVACGTGFGAIGLVEAGIADEVHACDLSDAMVTRTRANAGARTVHLARSDGEFLPYADGAFDLVLARGALHHLPSPVAALTEMRRVLAPGGAVVVLAEPTPQAEAQVAAVLGPVVRAVEWARRARGIATDAEHHTWELASMAANLHTFSPADIEALAEKAGFTQIDVRTASLVWILSLGVNYYLVGEFPRLARNPLARLASRAAARFDHLVTDRLAPASWRHTIQAVLR